MGAGQDYLEDAVWSPSGSRTAAMGRSRMWIEGHLRLSASGGLTGSVTRGSRLAHPRFLRPMEAATVIRRMFSPRVRTARLRGGKAQLSPEEDSRTSAEGGLPGRHVAIVCCSHLQTGGIQEVEEREGGPVQPPPPAAAVAATSVQGLIGPVPGRGGGGGGGGGRCGFGGGGAFPLRPRPRIQWGRPLGRRPAPGGLGWGLQVAWATTRNRRVYTTLTWGCPVRRHPAGALPKPPPPG